MIHETSLKYVIFAKDNLTLCTIDKQIMKAITQYTVFLILFSALSGCSNQPYHYATESGDYIIAEGGNMMWYNQPSAAYYKGKYSRTYFSWCDTANKINIAYYDEEHKKFSPSTTIHKWGYADDHGQPIVHIKKVWSEKRHRACFFCIAQQQAAAHLLTFCRKHQKI